MQETIFFSKWNRHDTSVALWPTRLGNGKTEITWVTKNILATSFTGLVAFSTLEWWSITTSTRYMFWFLTSVRESEMWIGCWRIHGNSVDTEASTRAPKGRAGMIDKRGSRRGGKGAFVPDVLGNYSHSKAMKGTWCCTFMVFSSFCYLHTCFWLGISALKLIVPLIWHSLRIKTTTLEQTSLIVLIFRRFYGPDIYSAGPKHLPAFTRRRLLRFWLHFIKLCIN